MIINAAAAYDTDYQGRDEDMRTALGWVFQDAQVKAAQDGSATLYRIECPDGQEEGVQDLIRPFVTTSNIAEPTA